MLIQSLAEYTDYAPPSVISSPELNLALQLIRDHRALDVRSEAIQNAGLTLQVMLQALLLISRENRFIKYDPWDATIEVKQFPGAFPVFLYNPHRDPGNRHAEGQQAPAQPGRRPDFLSWETFPDNEHYLIWTTAAGRHYGVLVQPTPIVPDHLIIASLDVDPASGRHYPQSITAGHLSDMQELQLSLSELGYAMGYNDRGAGASVDHFHTQAIPAAFLPLVKAYNANQLELSQAQEDCHGVRLAMLKTAAQAFTPGAYPLNGLVLEAQGLEAFLRKKQVILKALQMDGLTFNSLAWRSSGGRQVECFFPRTRETILNQQVKAGYVETSGMLVIPSKRLYDSITSPDQGWSELSAAGVPDGRFHSFFQTLRDWFLKS